MEIDRRAKKVAVKKRQRKSSTVEEYLADQVEAEEMVQEQTNGASFDSLRTALLQCIQDDETIENTVADLPANALEQFVHTLVDKMTNDPNNSKHAVRWLKLTVKMNMAVLMSLPDALGALRGCQAFIRKKETMLPTVMRMKGKIELALTIRRQKRDMHKEALDIEGMKPLVTIRGGENVQPQDGEAEDDNDDLDDELADDGIDDELDDELDDDEKLYQEAYENEELDEDLGGEEEDLEGLEDDDED